MDSVQEQFFILNKWRSNPDFRWEVGQKYRDLFYTLTNNFIDKDISISISGLRRVGKTTILFQTINYLLDKETDPAHIFYFQFSEEITNLEKAL